MTHRTVGEGGGYLFNSSRPLPPTSHLDISRAITTESSPMHIARSRTRTVNHYPIDLHTQTLAGQFVRRQPGKTLAGSFHLSHLSKVVFAIYQLLLARFNLGHKTFLKIFRETFPKIFLRRHYNMAFFLRNYALIPRVDFNPFFRFLIMKIIFLLLENEVSNYQIYSTLKYFLSVKIHISMKIICIFQIDMNYV